MSSSNPSDPQLLLPEWLRDGSASPLEEPAAPTALGKRSPAAPTTLEAEPVAAAIPAVAAASTPFSDRLSLDTRLDPAQLVSAQDLPKWLGGLDRVPSIDASTQAVAATTPAALSIVEEPAHYDGIEPSQEGVVDVAINGWILVAAAVGLLVLLLAALKLYLS